MIKTLFAPICIFCYNRKSTLQLSLKSLAKCDGVEKHPIFIFSDGSKHPQDEVNVKEVRTYLESVDYLTIDRIQFSDSNKGLANSIIEGVSKIIKEYGQVIVLEDDLILSQNFLLYMQQALDFYQSDPNVFSISGYSPNLPRLKNLDNDYFFTPRASSWGWASWIDRWSSVDWLVKTYPKFKYNLNANLNFARGGMDLPGMLRDQKKGRIDSWAIRWVYQQFLNNQVSVYPSISKVMNIGIGKNATHTKRTSRFITQLDEGIKREFEFGKFQSFDHSILSQFRSIFSIWRRLMDKLKYL